jgi:hypothetical protein
VSDPLLGGRYRVDDLIGRGGMATVWSGWDTTLDRPVAIKRLHAGHVDDPAVALRFDREAQVVAGVSHPNVVRLLDRGTEDRGPYLVLEYVHGETLKNLIRRSGALEPEEAVRICAEVGRGLAAAHARGIVHRDIKSQNILLAEDGTAKLADFGIARLMETSGGELTHTGMMVGSADYLAPEQAEGDPVDARADIYSLGIVLYECLTGELPFKGDNFVGVAMQHVSAPLPDPRGVVPAIPAHLADCVVRAAAKRPGARFASADAFVDALEGAPLAGATGVMPPPPVSEDEADTAETALVAAAPDGRRGRRRVFGGALAVVVALLVAGGIALVDLDLPFGDGNGGASAAQPVPLVPQEVVAYDPEGDGGERDGDVTLATDSDPDTAWKTERYSTPGFGNLKSGVGLLFRYGEPVRADQVVIGSDSAGVAFQILGPEVAPGRRPLLGEGTLEPGQTTVTLAEHEPASEYVLWFTSLAPDGDRYAAEVGEVRLTGTANT